VTYTSLLFDFDGTLAHSLPVWLDAYRFAFSLFGKTVPDEQIIERCFYREFDDVASEFSLPSAPLLRQKVSTRLWEQFEDVELVSGAAHTLELCSRCGVKLGIVSSASRRIVERTLTKVGVISSFQAIITADDTINLKPDPEPVLLALRLLSTEASKSLFVGDSVADMLAAHAAKTKTALFLPDSHSQFSNRTELLRTRPHFVFHEYKELTNHLQEHMQIS
jgi:HAD superfamily hydrolase (TIGR01549 family)